MEQNDDLNQLNNQLDEKYTIRKYLLEMNKAKDAKDENPWLNEFHLELEDFEAEPIHAGHPKNIKTPAEMAILISDYLLEQDMRQAPYTMYGLARRLGFGKELSALNRYQGYSDRFKRIIEIAQSIVLERYEERLSMKGMGPGIQFGLMNLGGWSKNEKQEVTHKNLSISFKQQGEPDAKTFPNNENNSV